MSLLRVSLRWKSLTRHYLILWNETFNINENELKELKQLKTLNKKLKKWI